MEEKNWTSILQSIRKQECIFILGPHATIDINNKALYEKVLERISKELDIIPPKRLDKLLLLGGFLEERGGGSVDTIEILEDIYEDIPREIHPMYYELARIPSLLYINTSPDELIQTAFRRKGIEFEHTFFNHSSHIEIEHTDFEINPTIEKPVVYNLWGSCTQKNSLIYTYDHLFSFIEQLSNRKHVPLGIRLAIQDPFKNFIFLGFDQNSWYYKVVLWFLRFHKKKRTSFAFHPIVQKDSVSGYFDSHESKYFKLNLIPKNVSEFISELVKRCEKDANIELRKLGRKSESQDFSSDVLQKLIKEGFLMQALSKLDSLPGLEREDQHEIILLLSKLNQLETDRRKGIISLQQDGLIRSKIIDSSLKIIDNLRK